MSPDATCTGCHKRFPLVEFRTGPDGRTAMSLYCRECRVTGRHQIDCITCGMSLIILDDSPNVSIASHNFAGVRVLKHSPSDHFLLEVDGFIAASCNNKFAEAVSEFKQMVTTLPVRKGVQGESQ